MDVLLFVGIVMVLIHVCCCNSQELENKVAGMVEKGIGAENGIIDTVSGIVPDGVKDSMPAELKELLLTRRDMPGDDVPGSREAKPLATWTISSVDEDSDNDMVYGRQGIGGNGAIAEEEAMTTMTVAESQAAAELVEIQMSVSSLKETIDAMKANTDESKKNMLKLNMREARQNLSEKLDECSSTRSAGTPDVMAAVSEAKALLSEVDILLL